VGIKVGTAEALRHVVKINAIFVELGIAILSAK
jgi:hypothetical protein